MYYIEKELTDEGRMELKNCGGHFHELWNIREVSEVFGVNDAPG